MYNPRNVSLLKSNLIKFSSEIDGFGKEMSIKKKPLNVVEQYYNSHIKRVRANVEGVIQLCDSYAQTSNILVPIAQILRSLLTDFLTAYYLFTFYDENDSDHTSFSNELKLLDRDAYCSVQEWMKVEEDLHKYNEHFASISPERIEARKTTINESFSDIFNEDGSIKTTIAVRQSSDRKFFIEGEKIHEPSRTVSEKYKIERLKRMEYFKMLDGYMLYKYFSQFYHESKLFQHLIAKDTVNENFTYLRWAFIPVYHMMDNTFRLFMKGENHFSKRLEGLKLELEAIGID